MQLVSTSVSLTELACMDVLGLWLDRFLFDISIYLTFEICRRNLTLEVLCAQSFVH